MAKEQQNELLALLESDDDIVEKKPKRKGPQTILVEEPLKMSGDPLGIIQTKQEETKAKTPKRVKSKGDIVVERYNPEVTMGLLSDDVEQRQLAGLANISTKGSTKSISSIIFSNVFTFFNLLIIAISALLIWSGASLTQLAALIIASINTTIGIIQEINAKKMIDKLSLLSAPTTNVIRDGIEQEVSVSEVVIDEIIKLSGGKQITVDA
ncbi:MAG TPA: hypothetical protein GYA04_00525, partial [Acholeplasma sp.]|nr:hypothetical protein [Acholeplasma sp.]